MNLRFRSAISRREAMRAGLVACLGASCARVSFGEAQTGAQPLITKVIPSTGERIAAIGLGSDAFQPSERDDIRAEIMRMKPNGRLCDRHCCGVW